MTPARPRILLWSLHYAPEPVGVGAYTAALAEALAAWGAAVQAVVGEPHYPAGVRGAYPAPGGWSEERGVRVLRMALPLPARRPLTGAAGRLRVQAAFLAAGLPRLWRLARRWRPDVVLAVAPALLAAQAAARVARACGAASWLHVQDFELDLAVRCGLLPGALARRAAAWERAVFRRFDYVSTLSGAMLARLRAAGVPRPRRFLLPNGLLLPRDPVVADHRGRWGVRDGELVVLYAGTLGPKQGLDGVLAAIERTGDLPLRWIFVGEGEAAARVREAASRRAQVVWEAFRPLEELPSLLAAADVHLLPQGVGLDGACLPSKLAAQLASGRPLVVQAGPGSPVARQARGAALVVPPGDPEALARAVRQLAASPALRARLGAQARRRARRFSRFPPGAATDWRLCPPLRPWTGDGAGGASRGGCPR